MNRIALIILGLISTLSTFSQNKFVKIEKNVNKYYADTLYSQIEFHYSNISDSSLVLWIEKGNVDSLSNSEKIQRHFFTKRGDWTLIQMTWDGNFSNYVPELFDSFIKIIKPKEQFTVSILEKGKINPDSISSYEKHIVIVKASNIKGFYIDSDNMFNFKATSVTIIGGWLK